MTVDLFGRYQLLVERATARARNAYVDGDVDLLGLDQLLDAILVSAVVARLYADKHLPLDPRYPHRVFVYWNATTLDCDGCGERRTISRWHLGGPLLDHRGDRRTAWLCRECGNEVAAVLGIGTR